MQAQPRSVGQVRLGFDSYTVRASGWDAIQTLDYAAKLKLEAVQFSELPHIARPMEKATDDGFLRQVRGHAEKLGIKIEMGTWGVCPTSHAFQPQRGSGPEQLGLAIRVAEKLGATSVRCVVGNQVERTDNGPIEKHIEAMIAVCRAVRAQALQAGVKIAIENHKELRAEEMRRLVEDAGPDYVGVCLDTGNPIWVLEDPMQTLETLAPYTVTSHFRDTAIWRHQRGAQFQWVPMGDGSIGIDAVVREFARRCPGVTLNLEIIAGRPPDVLAYLEPAFWKGFEKVRGPDFAGFVSMVERGRPPAREQKLAPNDPQQQREDLVRSLAWLRAAAR